ncbi:SMI1/KNR4 family protein [Streptomyces sp. NPDC057682]|uniref:SMI1/KNR4 family protein n=1 Tax=Streptomyces sp. NPDC057682 TaxID=3346210 RepID=UPI0036CB7B25
MSEGSFDWQAFLGRWQDEWVPSDDEADEEADEDPGEGPRRLGVPGASEAAIAAAEARLGRRLPPSYRGFLAASNGWQVDQSAGIYRLGGAEDVDWFGDPFDMTPMYEENLGENPRREDVLMAGMWTRALRLETDSDMSHALLDPGDTDEDGEWALYVYQGWGGEYPERYASFHAYMEDMYRGFHGDRAAQPGFVNATTRAQDAHVEEARRLALRGRYEEAVPLLEDAGSFGRPHSHVLLQQIRQFLAPNGRQDYGMLVGDPRYLSEFLPVQALDPGRGTWRPGGDDHWLGMIAARGVPRETAEALVGAVRDGTHRYAPEGAWGRAVARARDEARWGATDAAWRTLRAGLPEWETTGPSLIAPVGLLADPYLGPLITPERGAELLATPRSGERGPAPAPVPDLDPPGLVWITEPDGYQPSFSGYRCVWVEDASPDRLPALLGGEGAALGGPVNLRMTPHHRRDRRGLDDAEPWEDRATVSVGRTAEGWAFAFDGESHLVGDRLDSPAAAASATGRAVVVWNDPRREDPDSDRSAFHLSVAEQGRELYAFTVRDTGTERSGAIPEALDPTRLFRPEDTPLANERRFLTALHTELNLSLPRFALARGALHTFPTRSWTRAPRKGESYAYIGFRRHRG